MSRSNKNFADFFPTAPSVLQQKRSRPLPASRDTPSFTPRNGHAADVPVAPSASLNDKIKPANFSTGSKGASRNAKSREDHDGAQVDIVHEVGSASSTSTGAESVFSTHQKNSVSALPSGAQKSTSLTPLTNIDSSPRPNGIHSPPKRMPVENVYSLGFSPGSPSAESVSNDTCSNLERTPQQQRKQARPGRGEVKGHQIIYDPTFDKDKKKRTREPEFRPFGQEVC